MCEKTIAEILHQKPKDILSEIESRIPFKERNPCDDLQVILDIHGLSTPREKQMPTPVVSYLV